MGNILIGRYFVQLRFFPQMKSGLEYVAPSTVCLHDAVIAAQKPLAIQHQSNDDLCRHVA